MILYGAGGHGKVIYDRLMKSGIAVQCVFDDNPDIRSFVNQEIVHTYNPKLHQGEPLLISIGSNEVRRNLSARISHTFGVFIDLTAVVSDFSRIEEGSMVLINTVIQAESIIGKHSIINTSAVIEHDVQIGNYAHVGPGAVICGGAILGNGTFVGANATVLPGIKIGDWAVVGAGSVVTKNISAGAIVAGNPAKPLNRQ
jgi:sugar O-acyltransferase (sialic acid O-acetyltransferase NeuD family)